MHRRALLLLLLCRGRLHWLRRLELRGLLRRRRHRPCCWRWRLLLHRLLLLRQHALLYCCWWGRRHAAAGCCCCWWGSLLVGGCARGGLFGRGARGCCEDTVHVSLELPEGVVVQGINVNLHLTLIIRLDVL
jgi:hypothetical protein